MTQECKKYRFNPMESIHTCRTHVNLRSCFDASKVFPAFISATSVALFININIM